jgi:hypothetical protein
MGYFIHRLVRHDTVESIDYTRSFLPRNHKPFQQEQTSISAGPTTELRKKLV